MGKRMRALVIGCLAVVAAGSGIAGARQGAAGEPAVIVPHVRHAAHRPEEVRVMAMGAEVAIDGQVATTRLEVTLHNPGRTAREARVLLPVPGGGVVRSLQYDGTGPEPTAAVLPREEARRIYDSIVNKMRDPALLEFAGYNLIRTSVFPVPAGATQRVRIEYEELLAGDGGRVDYVLPRSESLESAGGLGPAWTIGVTITSPGRVAGVYSPSHDIVVERIGEGRVRVAVTAASAGEPGAFRLSYLPAAVGAAEVAATFIAYPDAEVGGGAGGYFLLLATAPRREAGAPAMKREVVVVIDRSGSMSGAKMEQARAAALQVLEGLEEGEAFNIIDYAGEVASFAAGPVIKSGKTMEEARAYLRSLRAGGGTDLNGALLEALRMEPTAGMLPLVLFLTDGLPTVGERNEVKIREGAKAANVHGRRVFTFGVGYDVNAPLLTALAGASRAASTFVLPQEDVEVKVAEVFRRLEGPVLGSPRLEAVGADGEVSTRLVRELQPRELMDLFAGDQVVVLGQYTGEGRVTLRLKGDAGGRERAFEFTLDTSAASKRNGFVPRLWASRKIGALLEEVRAMGASGPSAAGDPRFKELVDEIVRLSTKHGILTEYTAFLATEPAGAGGGGGGGGPVAAVPMERAAEAVAEELDRRALRDRSGQSAVAQTMNIQRQAMVMRNQVQNTYVDRDMREVRLTGVQLANDQAVFRRQGRWVDARLLRAEGEAPQRTVEFGTAEFSEVVAQLASEGRQAMLARGGDVYVLVQGERVLVRGP